jgi:origin recognition complex subunit 2
MPSGRAAKGKPYRRQRGHKPVSKDQMEFRNNNAVFAAKNANAAAAGGGARGGAAGGSGRAKKGGGADADAVAVVAADAARRLRDAEDDANAPRRGGRGFFATKGKNVRSEASLTSLDLADEDTVRELLGRLPVGHQNERAALQRELEKNYSRWWQLLQSEFSLLLYGFGSKKALMEDFAMKTLTDGGVVVVNGYHAGLTAKSILVSAAAALAATKTEAENLHSTSNESLLRRISTSTSTSSQQRVARARAARGGCADASLAVVGAAAAAGDLVVERSPRRLYIVLHNVDGAPLRNAESQALLGELAAMPRVHIIASVDHVNAPLLWSKREAARFNWVWQRATTFAPYHLETANVPQLLASKGEERHVRGASNVLRSLTSNARDIFRLLAEHQLQHPDEQGWKFHAFYTACREQFFATSEVTLRSHLTEFTDHELTRYKRSNDGEDLVVIPFAADILGQLLKEIHGV